MLKSAVPALAAAALLLPAAAQAAGTPGGSARAAADCLRARGWTAHVKVSGTSALPAARRGATLNATAPRKLAGYPYHPYISVVFYPAGFTPRFSETRMKLNVREAAAATLCRNRGVH